MTLADPLVLIAVLGIIVVLLLWGPKKIPELARAFGTAKREFRNGATFKDGNK